MSDLPKCPKCGEQFCPVNSIDENGDWDGSSKQNCDCDLFSVSLEEENKELRKLLDHIKRLSFVDDEHKIWVKQPYNALELAELIEHKLKEIWNTNRK